MKCQGGKMKTQTSPSCDFKVNNKRYLFNVLSRVENFLLFFYVLELINEDIACRCYANSQTPVKSLPISLTTVDNVNITFCRFRLWWRTVNSEQSGWDTALKLIISSHESFSIPSRFSSADAAHQAISLCALWQIH